MSYLPQIARRHGRDRWTNLVFLAAALVVTGVSIATAWQLARRPSGEWSVKVVDPATQSVLH